MNLHVFIYISTIFLSFGVMAWLSAFGWQNRHVHGAAAFAFMTALGAWIALAELLSITGGSPETAQFWFNGRYISLAGVPVAWFLFTLMYTGRALAKNPAFIILILIVPAVTQVMVWTNDFHGLWLMRDIHFYSYGPFLIADTLKRVPSIWFKIHTFYGISLMLAGVLVLLIKTFRHFREYRMQSALLAFGSLLMTSAAVIPTFNLLPGLRVNPFTQVLSVSALFFAWAIFRHRFLDMVPIARDMLIDNMEDCVLVLDMNNRIADANRAMLKLLESARDEGDNAFSGKLIGAPVIDVLQPWASLADAFLNDEAFSPAVEISVNGEKRHFDLRLTPIQGRGEKSIGMIMVLRDITERILIEDTLRENEERLRLISDNIPEGMVYQVDFGVDGSTREFTYVSAGVLKIHGLSPEEVMKDAGILYEQTHEDDIHPLIEKEKLAMEAMSQFKAEIRIRPPSGGIRWIQVTSLPRRLPNNHLIWDGIEIDITERKRIEGITRARLRMVDFAEKNDLGPLLEKTLDEICEITESPIGFFHFMAPDQTTLSLQAWSTRTKREFCKASGEGMHYPVEKAGVWVDCIRQRKPVIHNDYASLPHKRGLPAGHAEVVRELVVPIIREDKIVAILGVGNKKRDYDEKDIDVISILSDIAWEITQRKRAEESLKASEKALKERNLRMEADLKIAQAAQKGIIVGTKPKCERIAVDHRYQPVEKVGGDYFSFTQSPDGSLGVFIGDVSGHGLAAALFTSLLKSATDRMFREYWNRPEKYLESLNGEIGDYMASYFLTAIYGVFDSCGNNGDVEFRHANGGHPQPVIVRADGRAAFTGVSGNLIGISNTIRFVLNEERLSSGDRVFLYTDGIAETVNERKEMIGFDSGLLSLFDASRQDTLPETLDAIMENLNKFRGPCPFQDDITLIGFEVS